MQDTGSIQELVNYNLWANKRLIRWLQLNDEVLMDKQCSSSFSTINATLNHILSAEIMYYSLLIEKQLERDHKISFKDITDKLLELSAGFVSYVQSKSSLNDTRTINSKYIKGDFKEFELIQHCMNHSTYHRGQIVTMGRQLGLTKAPSTDMLFYFLKRNNTSV